MSMSLQLTDSGRPYVAAIVRSEAPTGDTGQVPDIEIYCANSRDGGNSYAESTVRSYESIPAHSFVAGDMQLMVPGDSATEDPIPDCVGPATIQATPIFSAGNKPRLAWVIDDDLLGKLNAAIRSHNATLTTAAT